MLAHLVIDFVTVMEWKCLIYLLTIDFGILMKESLKLKKSTPLERLIQPED